MPSHPVGVLVKVAGEDQDIFQLALHLSTQRQEQKKKKRKMGESRVVEHFRFVKEETVG
jgi:hypothetical protein